MSGFDKWRHYTTLGAEDLRRYPVWLLVGSLEADELIEQAVSDGELESAEEIEYDSGTLRPRDGFAAGRRPASFDSVALVAARLYLADGTEQVGYIERCVADPDREYQLHLVGDELTVELSWPEGVAGALGCEVAEIYPIRYESVVPIKTAEGTAPLRGVIER